LKRKSISNKDFDLAYKNQDNLNVMRAATKRYSNLLCLDSQATCGMHGLWKCLESHNPEYGRKFTTSLFIHVEWQCKREISKQMKNNESNLGDLDTQVSSESSEDFLNDALDFLPDNQKQIIYQRFYENRTLEEIGKKQGYTKEAARQNVNKIIKKIKENIEQIGL